MKSPVGCTETVNAGRYSNIFSEWKKYTYVKIVLNAEQFCCIQT